MKYKYFLIYGLLVSFLSGCTYNGTVGNDFYAPCEQRGLLKEKTAAIYYDDSFAGQFSHSPDGIWQYHVSYGSGTRQAMTKLFRSKFSSASETSNKLNPQADILIVPELEFFVVPDGMRCRVSAKMNALVLDTRDDSLLTTLLGESGSYRVNYCPEALLCELATYATLGLASPVTLPLLTKFQGDNYKKKTERALRQSLQGIEADLRSNEDFIMSLLNNPSVNNIEVKSRYDDYLNAVVVIRSGSGTGSGFLVSRDGKIITNAHVVDGEDSVSVKTRNGKVLMGSVISCDENRDLALVQIKGNDFTCLTLDDGTNAGAGNDVIAIGTPEGLSWSLSRGIVSARRKSEGVAYIQTDAPINHGNSGGPLIDLKSGMVVGINTFGFQKDTTEGLGFAVQSTEALRVFKHQL